MTDEIPPPSPDAPEPLEPAATGTAAAKPARKIPAAALTLHAMPPAIVRFRRPVVIGGAAAGALMIFGLGWMSLGDKAFHIVKPAQEKAVSDHRPTPEAVAGLPGNYGQVPPGTPVLGPPLPGDLGKPILDRQRELARLGNAGIGTNTSAETAQGIDRGRTRAQQDAEAQRERDAAQVTQAREAGVLVQSSGRSQIAAEAGSATPPAQASGIGTGAGDGARLALDLDHDQNNQQRKLDFVGTKGSGGIYNPHRLEAPVSPYEVMAGSVLPASLVTGLNSDLPGMIIAQVTENVYDSVTGRILLIPQGSRLTGSYDSVVAYGQKRALVVWQRLILPNGASLQIDNLPATDAGGYSGLADKVDLHTWQLLKGVGLSTLLGIGTQLSMSDDSDLVRAIRQSTQQSAGQAGQQIVGKSLNIQPTLTVRPGWPLRIIVHKDLILQPYARAR